MPGMSGFELLSAVRRRFPAIAVIAMSGAYSGVFIPPDVAAKGANGAARLFEILWSIEDRDTRESMRAAVPIWITNLSAHECGWSAVCCPECLTMSRIDGMSSGCTREAMSSSVTVELGSNSKMR